MGDTSLLRTPLHDLHVELGARMVPFAGYDMPVQYPLGVLKEHLHTRARAGLFDVSHMGQVRLRGGGIDSVIKALEALVPGDIAALAPGRIRYTMFTNDEGGILDDLMVTRFEDHLYVVINAGCKAEDLAHLKASLPADVTIDYLGDDAGLLALQGPEAASILSRLLPEAAAMGFMSARQAVIGGIPVQISRSGYTGEDGYEISVAAADAEGLARLLLAQDGVEAIGLGARDSLRLEAGLCLYGHDIDTTTDPVEAALTWTISKRRKAEGGFPGASVVQSRLAAGPARKRVGIQPEGKAPAREHTEIQDLSGNRIGEITSGGFGPTAGGPVAMGYVDAGFAAVGTEVRLIVRGKALPAKVAAMPFAPHRYFKG
ncbi:glycine cleavage system aminomethyltransferase GcvT [Niveispirillum fermenti]|uniref:glycine cleavage system aminomethyltransferase GcvT n=1 Tax=Niveispirillum fermenti TaxID=1233113 RepID=UPI003A8BAE6F